MERGTTKKRNWLAPWYSSLVCVAIVYATTLILLGNRAPMLVACLAIIAAIIGYLVCRVVQLRGRVTLAMAVIGFPLLTAMIFTAARTLAPFAERQATHTQLRAAGIRCQSRNVYRTGEWVQDPQGNRLPTWIAGTIGPDCMRELFSISGDLRDLQRFKYREIDGSTIRYVSIDRYGHDDDIELSQDFADWLEQLPQLGGMSVNLIFQYGDEQADIVRSSVQMIDDVLDRNSRGLVDAGSHFRVHASALAPESIRALRELPPGINLGLSGTTLDPLLIQSLAAENLGMLTLNQVVLPELASIPASDARAVREVHVHRMFVSLDQLRHLARIFQCERMSVEIDQASEEQIREFWSSKAGGSLQQLRVYHRAREPLRLNRRR